MLKGKLSPDLASPFDRPSKRQFIGIFKIPTHGKSACNACDRQSHWLEKTCEVHRGRVSFEIRVGAENDLADLLVFNACEELSNTQLLWPDAFNRVERTTEDVITPSELMSSLNGNDVSRIFHDTDL